ncbi:MAG: AAA family ATPase [Oscillatoriales cyanobacterium SM2_2_1]|nr:AAA family ATPase [Oscillatoriales cyanobacterium SM2_2_1]
MAEALILIGIPGSGKTTLARQLMQAPTYRYVSPDGIRQDLYGDMEEQGHWTKIWHQVEVQFLESAGRQSVIYDATNYRSRYRREVTALARHHRFHPITGLWLNLPLWLCLNRNQQRDRHVPEAIIIEMYRCLVLNPPHLGEGFDRLMVKEDPQDQAWLD